MNRTGNRARHRGGRHALALTLVALLLAVGPLGGVRVHAQPPAGSEQPALRNEVAVDAGPFSIPADGSFAIGVDVEVAQPTPYLEIRLQIFRPSGMLLFQRTEIRSDVETGTVDVEFARELGDLELRPDAYPYEVRVRTEIGEPREERVGGELLVHAANPEVTPVALVARISSAPRFDAQGHFVTDPGRSTIAAEQAESLAQAVLDDPSLRVGLAIAPVTLDEWARIASGYLLAEPEGLIEVPADDAVAASHASALTALRQAAATGRLELLSVPYADPAVGALAEEHEIVRDLEAHYAYAHSTYLATLETPPSAGTAVAGSAVPRAALRVLEERGIEFLLADADALGLDGPDALRGPRAIEESPVRALVLESETAAAIASGDIPTASRILFDLAIAADAPLPVVTVTDIGPGLPGSVDSLLAVAGLVTRSPWAELVTPAAAAAFPVRQPLTMPASVETTPAAPAGYWDEASESRRYAEALVSALGAEDPDAQGTELSSLIAQSASWAGPDGRWTLVDRGRAFASAAERLARSFLDPVSISARDVTLAGPRGEVPISIVNGSAKDLDLALRVRAENIRLTSDAEQPLTLRPQENFHTVGVDLQSALAGTLEVELWAGDVLLASGTSVVRASYLDRLAVVGGVALLLIGLLLYIRKRVRSADTDTIRTAERTDEVPGSQGGEPQ